MTWRKLSDDYGDDCWTLSDAAFRLHTEAIVWSNRKLLYGRIPVGDLDRFAKRPEAVEELLDVGWWSQEIDVFVIRHHAGYQRRREDVLHQQQVNRANRAKGKARPVREQWSSDGSSDDSTDERDRTGQDRNAVDEDTSETKTSERIDPVTGEVTTVSEYDDAAWLAGEPVPRPKEKPW